MDANKTSDGKMREWAKYSAYGIPFGLIGADTDSDGDCDTTDINQIQTWINGSAYDVRGDVNLDGTVNSTDKTLAQVRFQGTTLGWSALSDIGNRKGYAGYERDYNFSKIWHVRNRVLDSEIGRWTRRDPLGYVDGKNFYEYARSSSLLKIDPLGTFGIGGVETDGTIIGYIIAEYLRQIILEVFNGTRALVEMRYTDVGPPTVHTYFLSGGETFNYGPGGVGADTAASPATVIEIAVVNISQVSLQQHIREYKEDELLKDLWGPGDWNAYRHNCNSWTEEILEKHGEPPLKDLFPGYVSPGLYFPPTPHH